MENIDNEPRFRHCPNCEQTTPLDSTACIHCGALSPEATVTAREAAREYRFLHAVFTRSNPFTMIFIGINAGVFVLMCLAGGIAVTSVDQSVLLGFGAKQNNLITEQHQYWRLITAIFIHIGFIHLFLNNYALWIIGQEIERIYGSARFVNLYLATGVAGALGSYIFNPQAASAGASGAIFGLFGVMATFAFKYRREIPASLSRDIKRRVLPVIALNLLFGFSVRIVDNAAHLGGLLGGIVLALVVHYKRPTERITPVIWRALQVLCLAVMFVSFGAAFRNYNGPGLSLSNLTSRPRPSVETYFEKMKTASHALGESLKSFTAILSNKAEASDIRPSRDSVERGTRALTEVRGIEPDAGIYRERLLDLLNRQERIVDQFANARSKNWGLLEEDERELVDRYNQFMTDYSRWLPGFLKEHGYELNERNSR